MHEYAFDITLRASLRMGAYTEEAARKELAEVLDCAEANLGKWAGNDEPILAEVSMDGEPHLFEVDGEPAPGATFFHKALHGPIEAATLAFIKEIANSNEYADLNEDGDATDDELCDAAYELRSIIAEARSILGR